MNNNFQKIDQSTYNGRVNIIEQAPMNMFNLHDKIPVKSTASFRDALTGNLESNNLSLAFFSAENIQILQNGIRAGVYNKSNGKFVIGTQNEDELKIIMRSMYLQHSRYQPHNITAQIQALNKKVLDYCIHNVYEEVVSYTKYQRDASSMYTPMDRPQPVVNDKSLEFKPRF